MSDSDSNEKKPGVPSWQLEPEGEAPEGKQDPAPAIKATAEDRSTVVEQAKKFLQEGEVRDASTEKKIAFLESKGLKAEDVQELLGVTRNREALAQIESSEPLQPSQASKPLPVATPSPSSPPQKASLPPTTQLPPAPSQPPSQPPSQTSPPIITYPEFLIKPTAPRPLITRSRLLTTLYLFSGLSAVLYGTDTFLIKPMLKSLTESRLSLSSTANTNLQKLITKLEGLVSEIPDASAVKSGQEEDGSESDEDPTELFHRDIGIQTSPPSSRPSSPAPPTPLASQTARLQALKSSLSSLVTESASEGQQTSDLENTITVFRDYLDGMAYVNTSYVFGGVGGYGKDKEVDDEISKVKIGIRSVKGVLLSARSFPGGVRSGVR